MNTDLRPAVIGGNWKLNGMPGDCLAFARELTEKLPEGPLPEIVLAVPYLLTTEAAEAFRGLPVRVGVQNVSIYDAGAYTGEVSAEMLRSLEVDYCIVGHSERRAYYGETDAIVARKVDQLLKNDIRPIVCCGEVLEEREANKQFDVVRRQITDGLFHLTAEQFGQIIIAYEPVWAIGTGKTATPEQAQEIHAFIRGLIVEKYGKEVANNTSILYGGSCKPSNAKELFANPDVDGGLSGGAALKAEDFMGIALAF